MTNFKVKEIVIIGNKFIMSVAQSKNTEYPKRLFQWSQVQFSRIRFTIIFQ